MAVVSNHLASLLIATTMLAAARGGGAGELTLVDGGTTLHSGWQSLDLGSSPFEKLKSEPTYRSANPIYLALRLGAGGDDMISGLVDESGGTASGYDILYLDTNNNNSLDDDSAIRLRAVREGHATLLESLPVAVSVSYSHCLRRILNVQVQMRGSRGKTTKDAAWSAGCRVTQHLEGSIDIGDREYVLVGIYDRGADETPSNGCFDDYGVDGLRIDLNGDTELDPDAEEFLLSKVIYLDDRLWTLDTDAAGKRFGVETCRLPTGTLSLVVNTETNGSKFVSGILELAGSGGIALRRELTTQCETFAAPCGDYRVTSVKTLLADDTGREWVSLFSLPMPVAVTRSSNTVIFAGAPLRIEPILDGTLKRGEKICVSSRLAGAAGEIYDNVAPAKTRMLPAVSIEDSEEIAVAEGKMEYG